MKKYCSHCGARIKTAGASQPIIDLLTSDTVNSFDVQDIYKIVMALSKSLQFQSAKPALLQAMNISQPAATSTTTTPATGPVEPGTDPIEPEVGLPT